MHRVHIERSKTHFLFHIDKHCLNGIAHVIGFADHSHRVVLSKEQKEKGKESEVSK